MATLLAFGFGSLGLKVEDFGPDTVVQLGQPPRRIDLLTAIDGVDFGGAWSRRVAFEADGLRLHLIGVEDFKVNKRASGRAKDLADLDALDPPEQTES